MPEPIQMPCATEQLFNILSFIWVIYKSASYSYALTAREVLIILHIRQTIYAFTPKIAPKSNLVFRESPLRMSTCA